MVLVDGGLVVRAGGRYSCAVRPLIKICGRRAHFDVTVIEPAPVPPVRVVGGVVARKAGVARATGARLVFVHDDSVVDPDFVQGLLDVAKPGLRTPCTVLPNAFLVRREALQRAPFDPATFPHK